MAPCKVADAATEGEAPDAGGGDDAAGGRKAVDVRGVVEVAPGGAALGAPDPSRRVHGDLTHP